MQNASYFYLAEDKIITTVAQVEQTINQKVRSYMSKIPRRSAMIIV